MRVHSKVNKRGTKTNITFFKQKHTKIVNRLRDKRKVKVKKGAGQYINLVWTTKRQKKGLNLSLGMKVS